MAKKNFSKGLDALITAPGKDDTPEERRGRIKGHRAPSTRVIEKTSQEGTKPGYTRATFIVSEALLSKVKGYAYWERRSIKAIVEEALEQYFKDKRVKPVQEA